MTTSILSGYKTSLEKEREKLLDLIHKEEEGYIVYKLFEGIGITSESSREQCKKHIDQITYYQIFVQILDNQIARLSST